MSSFQKNEEAQESLDSSGFVEPTVQKSLMIHRIYDVRKQSRKPKIDKMEISTICSPLSDFTHQSNQQ